MKLRPVCQVALALFFVLCSACSSFDSRWKNAATSSSATRWEGRWTSGQHQTGSGHPVSGRLRAVIEPAPERKLTAHFRANWMIFVSDYTMTLEPKTTVPSSARVREFVGTHELAKIFGGTYRYEARLTADELTARYASSYDRGTFDLRRIDLRKDYVPADARH